MLHLETIAPKTRGLLSALCAKKYLSNHFLVGETALALQCGHRISIDLDLFSEAPFNAPELCQQLQSDFDNLAIINQSEKALHLLIDDVKVDILPYRYQHLFPLIAQMVLGC